MTDKNLIVDSIVAVDAVSPDAASIAKAADLLRSGNTVIYPTRSLYGLGVDAFNPAAVERVFDIKSRSRSNPLSVLIGRQTDVYRLVRQVTEKAAAIMKALWPGGVTLVFDAANDVPENLVAGTGKIGIRLPEHPVARALLEAVEIPITATSANRSGDPGCHRIDELPAGVISGVDMVLDAGPLAGGTGSTVVDVSVDPPRILRQGNVSANRIDAVLYP